MNYASKHTNGHENQRAYQSRNLLAFILFMTWAIIVLLLLIFDVVVYLVKDHIPPVLGYLTVFAVGNFIGLFTSASAFYFGEPKTTVSSTTLRRLLEEEDAEEESESDTGPSDTG